MADHVVADIEIARTVRGELIVKAGRRRRGAARRVFLMHGFNVGDRGMLRDYKAFLDGLRGVAPALEAQVETVQWPGEFVYWKAVALARGEYAAALARFLAEVAAEHSGELVFVAHSLGCRLIIEALLALTSADRARIVPRTRLFLMAAAVPTELFDRVEYDRLARACLRVDILYSHADQVLRALFPPGQFPEMRRWVTAVGLTGDPAGLWRPFRQRMRGHGHGRYWTDLSAAYSLAFSLGEVASRPVVSSRPDSREAAGRSAPRRLLAARDLPRRRPGT
jgi:hypothetical protein